MSENKEMKDSSDASDSPDASDITSPTLSPESSSPESSSPEPSSSPESSPTPSPESSPTPMTEVSESFELFPSYSKNRKYQKLYQTLYLVGACFAFLFLVFHDIYPFPFLYVIFTIITARYLFMTTPKEKSYLFLVVYFFIMAILSSSPLFQKSQPQHGNIRFFLQIFNQIAFFYVLLRLLLLWNVQHPNQNHLYSYLFFTLISLIVFFVFIIQNLNHYLLTLKSYFLKNNMGVIGNRQNNTSSSSSSSSFVSLKSLIKK